ncbi:hypothetical protein H310_03141 [Aphanomyces invadans]|uniref:Uncharacterized protein n=1 Tax=Aphanomyces invadans TaxID=157072 RepID=A0A024UL88_9STRA|nr:hypothetical protein H310_03141 [Aphanomyces invadans]ETW07069.1 hypothetical protein H310_03141 [Aphanomyces invadans]|eukprot:XP_008865144.1 hypothetical protein H310_03141 [Aphanomyces invadans]
MDPDDILDDMSLSSDDEMMDDMINEMKAEAAPPPQPVATRRQPRAVVRSAPPPAPAMPDLSQMMSQMMPMMSQMFGGMNAPPSNNRITRAMEDIVADHVPASEVASWVETIRRDEARQKQAPRVNLSRAYRPTVPPTPTAHLEASTLLQELLLPAVRAAKCAPSPRWEKEHLTIHREIQTNGIGDMYAKELRAQLRHRATHSADYKATPDRFPNLTSIASS